MQAGRGGVPQIGEPVSFGQAGYGRLHGLQVLRPFDSDHDPQVPGNGLGLAGESLMDQGFLVFFSVFPQHEVSVHAGDDLHVLERVGAHRVGRHAKQVHPSRFVNRNGHVRGDGLQAVEFVVGGGLHGGGTHLHQRGFGLCHSNEFLVGILGGRPVEDDAREAAAGQIEPGVFHVCRGDAAVASVVVVRKEPGRHAVGPAVAERPVGEELNLSVLIGVDPQVTPAPGERQDGHQHRQQTICAFPAHF